MSQCRRTGASVLRRAKHLSPSTRGGTVASRRRCIRCSPPSLSQTPKYSGIDLEAISNALEESRVSLEAMRTAYAKIPRIDLSGVAKAAEASRASLEAMDSAYATIPRIDLSGVAKAAEASRIRFEALGAAYAQIPRIDLSGTARAVKESRSNLEALGAAYAEIPRIDLSGAAKVVKESRANLEALRAEYVQIPRVDFEGLGSTFSSSFGVDREAVAKAVERASIDLRQAPFGSTFEKDLQAMRMAFNQDFGIDLKALEDGLAAAYGGHASDSKSPQERLVHDSGGTDDEDIDPTSPSPIAAQDQAQDAQSATKRRMETALQLLGTLSLIDDLFLGGTAKSALREAVGQSVTRIAAEFLIVLSLLAPAPAPNSSSIPTGQAPEAKTEPGHMVDKVDSERDVVGEARVPTREKDR